MQFVCFSQFEVQPLRAQQLFDLGRVIKLLRIKESWAKSILYFVDLNFAKPQKVPFLASDALV